jgi:hypothetical protein
MIRSIQTAERSYSHDPAYRGYHAVYRTRETNYCPGCGRTHWWIGRISAECVYCSTALPFADAHISAGSRLHVRCVAGVGPIEN